MHIIMTTISAPRRKRSLVHALTLGRFASGVGPHSIETLRGMCLALVHDLGEPLRDELGERIHRARSIDDFWHLRSTLFSAISLACGEQVARDRLAGFDARWQ
jgi:hypothetical protein